ncbi:hypothetical protein Bbelb_350010 [Branchiostoma belcheri]|nr:hypothetical protein Bbelb_350010 [Branchiostoma belcheri]
MRKFQMEMTQRHRPKLLKVNAEALEDPDSGQTLLGCGGFGRVHLKRFADCKFMALTNFHKLFVDGRALFGYVTPDAGPAEYTKSKSFWERSHCYICTGNVGYQELLERKRDGMEIVLFKGVDDTVVAKEEKVCELSDRFGVAAMRQKALDEPAGVVAVVDICRQQQRRPWVVAVENQASVFYSTRFCRSTHCSTIDCSSRGKTSQACTPFACSGRRNGVATLLKAESQLLVAIHCIAHRLALAVGQAGEAVSYFRNSFKPNLGELFRFFDYSACRMSRLHQIQDIMNLAQRPLKEAKDTRWLSHDEACSSLYKTLPAVLTSLEHEGRQTATASGLLTWLRNWRALATLYLLCDLLPHLSALSR